MMRCWPHEASPRRIRPATADALRVLGYVVTRQRGDHLRLTTQQEGEHHVSIPLHDPLRIGTFAGILSDVAAHFSLSRRCAVAASMNLGRERDHALKGTATRRRRRESHRFAEGSGEGHFRMPRSGTSWTKAELAVPFKAWLTLIKAILSPDRIKRLGRQREHED